MTRRKQGLGLFGLLAVAALGVMAFASIAQAAVPKFNLDGTSPHFKVGGTQEGAGILLVPTSNLKLSCTEFEVQEGLVLSGGLVAHAKLLYKGCTAFEHKAAGELPCHVSDVAGGDPTKLHVTANALLLPVEFADGKYGILAEKITAQVNFLSGTGCPLPLKNVITGEVCFKITSGNDTKEPLIQSSKTIQAECPLRKALEGTEGIPSEGTIKDVLKFGVNEAFVEGSAILKDTDAPVEGKEGKIGVLLF